MKKCLSLSFKYLAILVMISFCTACSSTEKEQEEMCEKVYKSLKDNQSKFIIKMNGDEFYKPESIFEGHLEILEKNLTISYYDQFESNVMIHFGGNKWYVPRPIRIPVTLESSYSSNVMIGRMKNKAKKLGEGYLMASGFLTLKSFTKDKIIMMIEGKAKKYPKVDEASPTYDVKGYFISKKPKIDYLTVDEKAAFYDKVEEK